MKRLRSNPLLIAILVGLIVASLAYQLPSYRLFLLGQLSVVIIVTSAMTVLMGVAGLLSLASAAFMGVGAYGALILTEQLGLPIVIAVPAIIALGGVIGGLLGLVALRLSGFHLAIVTLGFLQVLLVILKRGGAITGGGYGLVAPPLLLGGLKIGVNETSAVALFIMAVVVGSCAAAVRSRIGRAWLALRENEPAAQMQGIDVSLMKIIAFVFASALISLAGVLQVFLLGVANPNSYLVNVSIFHITLVVVGGMTGSLVGAVVAPIILYLLPEAFTALGEWRDFFYAAVLLLTLIFLPRGIGPFLGDFLARRRVNEAARV